MKQNFSFLVLLLLFSWLLTNLQAQDYKISFTGSGLSTTFTSILVSNLTQGTSLTLNNNEVLHLLASVSGLENADAQANSLRMYPNPMEDRTEVKFSNSVKGYVKVEVIDLTGKSIIQESEYLDIGRHTFELSGLKAGIYMVKLTTSREQYAGKLLSGIQNPGNPGIRYVDGHSSPIRKSATESIETLVPMQYNEGDRLLLTGISGDYSHVFTLVPNQNQSVNFEFIACTDADNNHYPVVTIGTQTWMARNLKTTKYNDGAGIQYPGNNNETWMYNTAGAYAWYNNNTDNKEIYGALYNWFAVETGKLCPLGWRVPSDADWYQLENFVDGTINDPAAIRWRGTNGGTRLKSKTLWSTGGGTDDFGFNALPGGLRQSSGVYAYITAQGYWHSSTLYNTRSYAWYRSLRNVYNDINRDNMISISGHSVRCIRDK